MDRRYQDSINLSDFKSEHTVYLQKTPVKSEEMYEKENKMFQPSEITARSTLIQSKLSSGSSAGSSRDMSRGIGDILASSYSDDVRKFYRESLCSLPRTADLSRDSIVSGSFAIPPAPKSSRPSVSSKKRDFWDISLVAPMEFEESMISKTKKSFYDSQSSFMPAENMMDKLEEDQVAWAQEEAIIPTIQTMPSKLGDSMWENHATDLPNYSIGQYFKSNSETIRDIYPNPSPKKRTDRVAMNDVTNSGEDSLFAGRNFNLSVVKKALKAMDSPTTFINKLTAKQKTVAEKDVDMQMEIDDTVLNSRSQEENFMHSTQIDRSDDPLRRQQNCFQFKVPRDYPEETPKSSHTPLKRARSPAERQHKPPIPAPRQTPQKPESRVVPENRSKNFASPQNCRSYDPNNRSPSATSSIPKLSLPSYALQNALCSPTTSIKSSAALVKRATSELSSGASRNELEDDGEPFKLSLRKISWETVKLLKSSQKSVIIKNKTIRKQTLKISVEGPGFQLVTTEMRDGVVFMPSEVRNITIEFSPTRVGPAMGAIYLESTFGYRDKIPLYAYGGHVTINIIGSQKGPYGPHFVTLGTIHQLTQNRYLEHTIHLKNNGTLPAFATLAVDNTNRAFYMLSDGTVAVTPCKIVVNPGCLVNVTINYRPKRDQLRHLIQKRTEVITIGQIYVFFGDEASRLRVLRYAKEMDPQLLKCLPESFPNDNQIKAQLIDFNEDLHRGKMSVLSDQFRSVTFDLTVNQCLDETQILCPDWTISDDSSLFRSFYENEGPVPAIEVSPNAINFMQIVDDLKEPKIVYVKSLTRNRDIFMEIGSNAPELLTLHPKSAAVSPGEILEIRVYGNFFPKRGQKVNICITVENVKFTVPVIFISEN